MQNEIMINKMYVGEYISNGFDNIGHEIINLFQADNGKYYIYAMSDGSISNIHDDKVKSILLVRNCGKHTLEILAKAEGLTQLTKIRKSQKEERANIHQEQIQYIKENHITYGGIELYKIFENNLNNDNAILYTFEAKKVVKPKNPIYVTDDDEMQSCFLGNDSEIIYLEDKKFAKQSLKIYINSSKNPIAYEKLETYINNDNLWEKKPVSKFVQSNIKEEFNFISILGKDYDELAFSNMFKHFFSVDKKLFCTFAKEILNIENFDETYKIEREKANTDLLIQDKNNVIVIENKIKSGINGSKYEECDLYSQKNYNQLVKYDRYIEENFKDKNKYIFIFAPDYNKMIIDFNFTSKYFQMDSKRSWKPIKYSKILEFYKTHKIDHPYFNEFLYALEKHSHSVDNNLEKEMYKRLNRVIQNKKGK